MYYCEIVENAGDSPALPSACQANPENRLADKR